MGKGRTILRYAMRGIVLPAAVLMVSCGRECAQEQYTSEDPTQVRVGFRIALGEPDATRATPAGDYDDGTGVDFENYIDVEHKNYRILFFDTQNKYLASFQPQDFMPVGDDPVRSKVYEVIGQIDRRLPRDFKMVVLANWPAYPENPEAGATTIEQVCTGDESLYAYAPPFVCSQDSPIPMYGVRLYEGVEFRAQTMTYLGTVHLLRAMAKAEVFCDTEGWTLDKVVLHRYNRTGCCAPAGVYSEADYVKGDHAADYVDAVHVPDGTVEEASIPFRKLADGRFVIYMPEHRNVSAGAKRDDAAEIRVTFEERADKEYLVEFKYYNDPPAGGKVGDPFDVRRNNYYKFELSKSDEFAEPAISVDVYPYDLRDLRPGFGEEPKTSSGN